MKYRLVVYIQGSTRFIREDLTKAELEAYQSLIITLIEAIGEGKDIQTGFVPHK